MPADTGRAWVILAASFGGNYLHGVLVYFVGVIHAELLDKFQGDITTTSWAGAVYSALASLAGGVLMCVGFSAAALATSVIHLLFTYGLIAGTGAGLTYSPALMVVAFNFDRLRALASGISVAGVAVGILSGSIIAQSLIDTYGMRGAFLLIGGIALHYCVVGMFFTPSRFEGKRGRKTKREKRFREEDGILLEEKNSCDVLEKERLLTEDFVPNGISDDVLIEENVSGDLSEKERLSSEDAVADCVREAETDKIISPESDSSHGFVSPRSTSNDVDRKGIVLGDEVRQSIASQPDNTVMSESSRTFRYEQNRPRNISSKPIQQINTDQNAEDSKQECDESATLLNGTTVTFNSEQSTETQESLSHSSHHSEIPVVTSAENPDQNAEKQCQTSDTFDHDYNDGRINEEHCKFMNKSDDKHEGENLPKGECGVVCKELSADVTTPAVLQQKEPAYNEQKESSHEDGEKDRREMNFREGNAAGNSDKIQIDGMHKQPCARNDEDKHRETKTTEDKDEKLHRHETSPVRPPTPSAREDNELLQNETGLNSPTSPFTRKRGGRCGTREANLITTRKSNKTGKIVQKFRQEVSEVCVLAKNLAFVCHCVSLFFVGINASGIYLHLPEYVKTQGTSPALAATLFVGVGVVGFVARLGVGFLTTISKVRPLLFSVGLTGMGGLATTLFPLYSFSYGGQMVFASFFGASTGGIYTLINILTVDLVGLHLLAVATGVEVFMIGLGYIIGPPLAGVIVDNGGTYTHSFTFLGAAMLLASLLDVISRIIQYRSERTPFSCVPSSCDKSHDLDIPVSSSELENGAMQSV